ncbi:GGDEF and EAL domain-containing protein [Pelotalea chapellei]|uniref:EAL domain-containing protein n=1 Tax=Pelotalea chapellei TaxID=44671 RepID=A0ABS5U6I1_9BACT|nr:GGDEF and EAL domain-containing protein [Pelotalea chapellei]MBT1071275.1 EAL domain-containing protein [Pelotalea chapellei]
MRRKIILSFLTVFLLIIMGACFATMYAGNVTSMLSRLIQLHQIEGLRHRLIMSIQTVQSDLYTVHTTAGRKLDSIADNVALLEQAAEKCSSCHHTPEVTRQIEEVQSLIDDYQNSLSYYITASANFEHIDKLKFEAAGIGNTLLLKTEDMSVHASSKLNTLTTKVMSEVKRVSLIFISTMLFAVILSIFVAARLTKAITRPIDVLVNATRVVSTGDMDHLIDYTDRTEFGELASHFNAMITTLKNNYTKLEKEIRERKRTESELVKSESFLSNIFDSIRDPFCIIDKEFRVIRANEAYAEMKQVKLEDILDKICYESHHGQTSACEECIVERTFTTGASCTVERMDIAPDGSEKWNLIHTYPILDRTGALSHVIEYARDITERKKSEEALRESEERYALAARGSNDGLWDWDLRNDKIYFSYRWKSMLGYDEEEIGNSPDEWFNRIHPDDLSEVKAKIAAHINGVDQHYEGEFRILHQDGNYRWMLSRGLAVCDTSGSACRMAGSQTDITSRKTATEQLVYNAFHDNLTGLPNRALFMDRLQHVVDTQNRRSSPMLYAVLFLDMDRFKVVNDSMGHQIGDKLLVAMGQRLTECLRPGDTVARLGGDEFSILLENICLLEDAYDVADRIHQALSTPFMIDENEVYASVSVGIAPGPEGYERAEQVLRDADIAMYQAKKRHDSSTEIFDSTMHASILDRIMLESDLHAALVHNEFVLFYQPIIDLKTHALSGFEALVRWNHPSRGLVLPAEFIPVAEETGMIAGIGEWIILEACRELKSLQTRYPAQPPLKMNINISGRQFAHENLADMMANALQQTGVIPQSVALEITESMLLDNVELAIITMNRIREMGVEIHIDDFGTGYSSLSYLHRLPINALKVDRSFISKLTENGENQEIIRSVISLANSLNLDVIAEGVELNHQLEFINELECQFGQGYLFSKPMEAASLDEWIMTRIAKKG